METGPPADEPVARDRDGDHAVTLGDVDGGRATVDLLGSLLARAATLQSVTGAQAVGSLVAGLASLGQHAAATTADGARLRAALVSSRLAANAEALWARLGTGDALAASPPTPVLTDFRNDLALLLAHDLDASLADLTAVEPSQHIGPLVEPRRTDGVDLVVGLWAYSTEIVAVVEALTAHHDGGDVREPSASFTAGPMLR